MVPSQSNCQEIDPIPGRARNFPVAPNPLLHCKEWREALVPDSGSIWTLETDLGILLASPFKAATTWELGSKAAVSLVIYVLVVGPRRVIYRQPPKVDRC